MSELIDRQHVIDVLTGVIGHLRHLAEPDRKFLEIIVEYPKVCTYPEYEGKPYYSIKYEENGEIMAGFGTYKPEVLSQYLRDYFISATKLEQTAKVEDLDRRSETSISWEGICTKCGAYTMHEMNYCFCCGAKLEWE